MLVGSYQHNVDTKGRVFIPAKYRMDLGSHFYVNRSHDGCIRAYSETEWMKVMEKLSVSTVKSNHTRRRILASTKDAEMDAQGRILLPEELRVHAGITDSVWIVGMGEWAEFWSPENYERIMNEDDEDDEIELMASLGMR